MKPFFLSFLIALCFIFLVSHNAPADELFLYAGAGLRKPIDKIVKQFQKETGHKVIASYGGSGKQMARFLATKQGDLFMPGSYFYIKKLHDKGLITSDRSVVYHTPVIAVNKNGKHKIESLVDMTNPGVKLALGDPKAMAFGRIGMKIIENAGIKKEILNNVVVYGVTVNQLALYVVKRTVDAAIIGRSIVTANQDSLYMIDIPAEYYSPDIVAIAILKTSNKAELAKQFQRFVSNPAGIDSFMKFGFLPIEK